MGASMGQVAEPENRVLEAEICERIRRQGPMTFAAFMDLALYHPEHGYYSAIGEKIGPRGDFCTSPETHPVFGALIARQLEQMWSVLGAPDEFRVVEVGAGNGSLCAQIVRFAPHSEFHRRMRYEIVEKSAELVKRQRQTLSHIAPDLLGKVSWFVPTESAPLPRIENGCFLANELLDAFPVHRVAMREGRLKEIYVGQEDGRLVDVVGELSTPDLARYFALLGIDLAEGIVAEVNLVAVKWIREVANALGAGFAITIDYGFPAEELFTSRRRQGTLMCYYRHTYSADPYARVGQQDMTTHVDFTSLIRAGREVGLGFVGFTTQADFLGNLGLDGFIAALDGLALSPAAFYDNKFAMRRLGNPEALGKFKALVQRKGAIASELDCFNSCNDRKRELITGKEKPEVPLL